jgi:hypothetical protein
MLWQQLDCFPLALENIILGYGKQYSSHIAIIDRIASCSGSHLLILRNGAENAMPSCDVALSPGGVPTSSFDNQGVKGIPC